FIDIFVHDIATSTTTLISKSANGTPGNGHSVGFMFFSGDGNRLVFESFATNLLPADTDNIGDILLWERQTGALQLISTSITAAQGNGAGLDPFISHDGKMVLYHSKASNLVSGAGGTHSAPDDLIMVTLDGDEPTLGLVSKITPHSGQGTPQADPLAVEL